MINYTTPTITLTVEDADLTSSDVYVTMAQGDTELTKSGSELNVSYDGTDTTITFTLTQTESATFNYNRSVQVQVNFINTLGVRDATSIATIEVMKNLLDEELEASEAPAV